jgi:hypothetical protein
MIAALQLVLKPFTIENRQLQGKSATSHSRATNKRSDEYYPVVEVLLDHLERTSPRLEGIILGGWGV